MADPFSPVHIHLDWGRSPAAWRKLVEAGKVWEQDPYGYRKLEEFFELTYSSDKPEGRLATLARKAQRKILGMDLLHAWRNRPFLEAADYVVTHTENEYLAVLLLFRLFRNDRTAVICQAVWLWDRWHRLSRLRKLCYRKLMARAAVLTVHSTENAAIARAVISNVPVVVVPFGVRLLEKVGKGSAPGTSIRIFSAGNDIDRDWTVLARAVGRMPSVEVRVRTGRKTAQRAFARMREVDVAPSKSVNELLSDLAWCDIVVVPLRENHHASGLTATLEGLAADLPVVVADVGGLKDYFEDRVTYYNCGDVNSLLSAIDDALGNRWVHGRRDSTLFLVQRGLQSTDYALRHALIVQALKEGKPIPALVSEKRGILYEDVGGRGT